MELLGEIGWQIFSVVVVLFIFYAAAHTWLIRPIITLIERIVGREFFPYLDRVFPR